MLNMETQALGFELPPLPKKSWYRAIDTALAAPDDISAVGSEQLISGSQYIVNVRSVCVLIRNLTGADLPDLVASEGHYQEKN